ncbi:hypothetical protein [Nocardiopsis dassonvillei]|uniref:hypothetical protein n=1 Tax=Nocardiopsis dassonvillei TaxID=2014 RepID=UPI00157E15BC|nr:hypothetical protein [Nocardiopsis dassonvillei]
MDLREKIAEVLYEAPASDGALAKIACDVALRRAQRRADAVMGVVEEEIRRQHQDAKCVPYGAYQRVCGLLTRAEAETGAANARVRELEDENQRMRDGLAQAVKMRDVNNRLLQCAADRANRAEAQARAARGTVADLEQQRDSIAARIVEEERGVQEQITKEPLNSWLAGVLFGLQRGRDIVTSPARETAEEEK